MANENRPILLQAASRPSGYSGRSTGIASALAPCGADLSTVLDSTAGTAGGTIIRDTLTAHKYSKGVA